MVSISETNITMIRGDTAKIQVSIFDASGEIYEPQNGDSVRFAAKKKYTDSACVILKDIPIDTLLLQLDPDDTEPLGMGSSHGKYVYDIKLTKADGTVDTFIRGVLILLEEVD